MEWWGSMDGNLVIGLLNELVSRGVDPQTVTIQLCNNMGALSVGMLF